VVTKELKGNFVKISKSNFKKWSEHKWRTFNLKSKYSILDKYISFKEKILDRVVEYFFGYYKNPIKRMFQFSNIKKVKRLFKD
jgi:tyrosyl-tRNA synthetase